MKKIILYLIFAFTLIAKPVLSQVVMSPPEAKGKTQTRFYYIPDLEIYFDMQSSYFIYYNGTAWKSSEVLPVKYSNVDINSSEKVMLNDFSGTKPYLHFASHKLKYPKGYKNPPPKTSKPYDMK